MAGSGVESSASSPSASIRKMAWDAWTEGDAWTEAGGTAVGSLVGAVLGAAVGVAAVVGAAVGAVVGGAAAAEDDAPYAHATVNPMLQPPLHAPQGNVSQHARTTNLRIANLGQPFARHQPLCHRLVHRILVVNLPGDCCASDNSMHLGTGVLILGQH